MKKILLSMIMFFMFTVLVFSLGGCATGFGSKEGIRLTESIPTLSDEQLYEFHSKTCLYIRTAERAMSDNDLSSMVVWGPEERNAENVKYKIEAEMRRRGMQVPY